MKYKKIHMKEESYSILITDVAKFRRELIKMVEQVRYETGEYSVGSSTQVAERFEHFVNDLVEDTVTCQCDNPTGIEEGGVESCLDCGKEF